MDTKFDFGPKAGQPIVYVLPVAVTSLPDEVRAQVPGFSTLYAVHDADGERIALVRDRALAFALARQNDMAPVNAH
ncbi:MAG: DUF1150 family protein [Rhodobacteraceae bacterium]|nr:DUF1150 family protein [Paracoccaceae bacterium]